MNDRFLELIAAFTQAKQQVAKLFSDHVGLENPVYWRQAGLPRSGALGRDEEYQYVFHGIGCRFSHADRVIDFDFGHDGRLDGFNSWWLQRYAEEGTDAFPEFRDDQLLQTCFKRACETGQIRQLYKSQQDDLFYMVLTFSRFRVESK